MPVTRQTTYQPDEFRADMKEAIQSELHQFFKSSDFKTILSEAVNTLIEQSVQQATFPLIKRIEALETELTKVTIKANENEQY
jgi:predicted HAD superfamily phosphohydrolase YqeG